MTQTATTLKLAYKRACMGELEALKPGNVHIFADGHGMTIHDFIKSADASAEPIARAGSRVGQRILGAIQATQAAVGTNTNLGVVLLCAPMIETAYNAEGSKPSFTQQLKHTLNELTVADAVATAEAILLANPAGLGQASEHDVHEQPSVSLLAMMQSAQDKDRIAWQYANDFADIIGFGVPCYQEALAKWQTPAWATTALYLNLLAKQADTHIARKYGSLIASEIQQEAKIMADAYWLMDNPKLIQQKLIDWDASLKGRKINPGTTADLTVASLLAAALISS